MSSLTHSSLTNLCRNCRPSLVVSDELSPRVGELLKSNEPLSDAELAAFSEEVAFKRDRLSHLEGLISDRVHELEGLLRERETVCRDLQILPMIIHPIRRLPAEILQRTFALSMDVDANSGFVHHSLDSTKSPWVFTHVSRRWREVALGYPLLWSYVGLDSTCLDARDPKVIDRMAFLLGAQLHRSSASILAVSLRSRSGLKARNLLLQLVRPTSPHWERLFIDIPLPCMSALSAIEGFLPLLRELHQHDPSSTLQFISYFTELQLQNSSFPPVFGFVPKLCSVTIGTPMPTFQLCNFATFQSIEIFHELPLPGRSILFVPDVSRNSIILSRMSNLRICTLQLAQHLSPSSGEGTPILLPLLDRLTVVNNYTSSEPLIQLFRQLRVPALRHLAITGPLDATTVASCAHSLHVLEISGLNLTEEGMSTILHGAPLLQRLVVHTSPRILTNLIVQQLSALTEDGLPLVCPSLQILNIQAEQSPEKFFEREWRIFELENSRPVLKVMS